jgi:hypothetical protein
MSSVDNVKMRNGGPTNATNNGNMDEDEKSNHGNIHEDEKSKEIDEQDVKKNMCQEIKHLFSGVSVTK